MPLLEQRRQPYPAQARALTSASLAFSTLLEFLRGHWALTWSLFHLGSVLLGGTLCTDFRPGPAIISGSYLDLLTRFSAAVPLVILLGGRHWQVAGWVAVVVMGTAGGFLETSVRESRSSEIATGDCQPAERRQWTGTTALRITGWPSPGSTKGTWRAPSFMLGFADAGVEGEEPGPLPGDGVLVRGKGPPPVPGSILSGRVTFGVPSGLRVPGGFDYRKFLRGRCVLWNGTIELPAPETIQQEKFIQPLVWLAGIRSGIAEKLEASFPPAEAALLGAVLLGIRTGESRTLAEPFADLGLAHLFAVSGLHVGILMGIVYLPLFYLGCSPTMRFGGLLIFLALYAALTGMSGSVIRATGLALTTLAALPLGSSRRPLHILGILFWLGMIWLPGQVLDAGNRLSYLAAGGILAVMIPDRAQDGPRPGGAVGWVAGGLTVSLAALWFTLPQVAASFGRLSPFSPCANLLAVPLFGLGIWVSVLGLALQCCWLQGGDAVLAVAWVILRFLAGASALAARGCPNLEIGLATPGPLAGVWFVSLTGILLLGKRYLGRRIDSAFLTPALLLVLLPVLILGFVLSDDAMPWSRKVQAWQFDVGQADCALLFFPDGWATLIDTGGKMGTGSQMGRSVVPFLRRQRCHRLDAVFLTHGHLDHTAGVGDLLRRCRVDTWYVGGSAGKALVPWPKQIVLEPQAGEVLHTCGQWSLVCLQGAEVEGKHLEENDLSLVIALLHGQIIKMIWNGDLENAGERILGSSSYLKDPVQVWKAGHHGSATSGSAGLLEKLDPDLILISCGVGNRYGHPSHGHYLAGGDTLAYLRTDLVGTIAMEWSSSSSLTWWTTTPPRRRGTLP